MRLVLCEPVRPPDLRTTTFCFPFKPRSDHGKIINKKIGETDLLPLTVYSLHVHMQKAELVSSLLRTHGEGCSYGERKHQ